MSSTKTKDESVEEIEEGKPLKETERCGTGRASRLPTHGRSSSVSGQKSKIPTNVGHAGRPVSVTQSQIQDNFRLLTSAISDEPTVGNASPINSGRFSASKSLTIASSQPVASTNLAKTNKSSVVPIGNSAMLKRHLETQFATKKKRYVTLKKELTDKQKNAIDLYEEMSQLREKMIASGAKDPGKIETINLTGIPGQSCAIHLPIEPLIFRASGEHIFTKNSSITIEFISSIESKIREIPKRYDEFFKETLRKNSELLELYIKTLSPKGETEIDSEIVKQIEIFKNENSDLATRFEETTKNDVIETNETIKKISIMWNEIENSRARICELEKIGDEMTKELSLKFDTAMMEKKSVEEKCEQLRERKVTLETELQKLRKKIQGMETRISEDENTISQLQNSVKNHETQLKQKESSAEQRLKEMQKSLKNSESLLAKMEKQRDSFESRLNELKKNFSSKENEAEKKTKELSKKLDAVNAELAKERDERQTKNGTIEEDGNFDRSTFENRLAERDEKIANLEREKQEIIGIINPGLLNDENTPQFDEGENVHEKIVAGLTKKMQDLRLNFKLTQERNETLQRQLTEFRSRGPMQSKESDKSYWSDRVMELEKQVYELRLSVNELTRRNEDLEIALNQKRLEIEEQDRIMRERNNVLKVRDEVIELIKGKPESRGNGSEGGHLPLVKKKTNQRDREQVDKQIAEKTENLQQLYSTLETKQMQITRLEQLVQQMEIQQERAQEQRTRLEKKIAQLQLAIHYKKGHRYVSPENPKVSSANVSSPTFCELSLRDQQSLSGQAMQNSSLVPPRSSSRPTKLPRSPLRHQPQPMQRSKTLNSFHSKARSSSSKIYASQVMDEVARALKRERDYDFKKRAIARDEISSRYSRQDRGSGFVVNNDVLDDLEISKDDIHESFYNWLVEPWMFEGSPFDEHCPNDWTRANRSANSTNSFHVRTDELSPSRGQRITKDSSRELRCDSPECRRRSATEWNCSPEIRTRTRTSPQETKLTRSRRQRSQC